MNDKTHDPRPLESPTLAPAKKPYRKPVLRELGRVDTITLGSGPPAARRKHAG